MTVTVIPPDKYRDRFRRAMDYNFLVVPGEFLHLCYSFCLGFSFFFLICLLTFCWGFIDKWIKVDSHEGVVGGKKLPPVL